MTPNEWRVSYYSPLKTCYDELSTISAYKLSDKLSNICKKYGIMLVRTILAHTVRSRRYALNGKKALIWADSIEPIMQDIDCYNPKRDFHELQLKCSDKILLELTELIMCEVEI